MDFSKFDNRAAADAGYRHVLTDPVTGEVITTDDGEECAVIVKGVASREVQAFLRKRSKTQNAKSKSPDLLEDVHQELIEAASPLVISFENVDRDDRPLTTSKEDLKWFFDLTFPMMEQDERKEWRMVNNPFAKQVAKAAQEQDNFLHEGAKA